MKSDTTQHILMLHYFFQPIVLHLASLCLFSLEYLFFMGLFFGSFGQDVLLVSLCKFQQWRLV